MGPRIEAGALRPLRGRTCRKRQALLFPPRYTPARRPCGLPCVTRPVRRLRNSPLRGSDTPRRNLRTGLRYSAAHRGPTSSRIFAPTGFT